MFRYLLAALVAVFALLQLNDPDPVVWVVAYGLVAVCVAAPQRASAVARLSWLTGGVLLTLALIALPGFVGYLGSGKLETITAEMSSDLPYVEPARELLGIVIAAAVLIGVRYRASRARSPIA